MIRRRQINAARGGPRMRSLRTAAGSHIRSAVWAVEERIAWPVSDLLRGVFDVLRWPFERAAWIIERAVVWPLGERAAKWGTPRRTAAIGSVALLATGAIAFAAIRAGSGSNDSPTVAAAPASAPVKSTGPASEPAAPVLHGAVPDFTPEAGDAAAKVAKADTVISSNPDAATRPTAPSSAATASSSAGEKVVDPGPAAIDVARRFSGAFVLYETGRSDAKVRKAFRVTASPRLTRALLRRPPRLPANVEVPKARVLNVVPGPRHGGTFTLSASLLRVGVTSELRIDVQRDLDSGEWQVTDVLG
jgi:hypothetical protein